MKTINKEDELAFKKLIKKIYDNSFYPATYNIEKNCFEYPEMPNVFYWPSPEYCKLFEDFSIKLTSSMIKEFSDKYGSL